MADNSTPHPAGQYDRSVRQTIPYYEQFHSETIDLVHSARPDVETWLDTGCGSGSLVEQALIAFPNTRFLLADPSAAMLEQVRERLAREIEPGGRVLPLLNLPSQDLVNELGRERVQVISAIQCHHYLQRDELKAALLACYDLLQPGGLLVAFENVAPLNPGGLQIGLERWGRFQIRQGRTPEEAGRHRGRYGKEYFPITILEHLDLLRTTGFSITELFWASYLQAGFYAVK